MYYIVELYDECERTRSILCTKENIEEAKASIQAEFESEDWEKFDVKGVVEALEISGDTWLEVRKISETLL